MSRVLSLLLTTLFSATLTTACAPEITFVVPLEDEVVVDGVGLLGDLLGALPSFAGLNSFDISTTDEFENNNAQRANVKDAYLLSFALEATSPANADLDFLDSIVFSVSAPGVDTVQVASATIPRGVSKVELDLDDVDLTPYVRAESITFTTDVSGRQPANDTTIFVAAELLIVAGL